MDASKSQSNSPQRTPKAAPLNVASTGAATSRPAAAAPLVRQRSGRLRQRTPGQPVAGRRDRAQPSAAAVATEKRFFCVRGYMKSGTNWVGNLLNLHPSISCVGEFHWQNIRRALDYNFSFIDFFQNDEIFRRRLVNQFENLFRRNLLAVANPQATWIGDRTPAPIEPLVFDQVPHITIIRDGRDVTISRAFHLLNRNDNPVIQKRTARDPVFQEQLKLYRDDPNVFEKHPEQLLQSERFVRETARAWANFVKSDRQTQRTRKDLPILFVRYEQLHRNTEAQRRRMYEFLGVDPQLAAPLTPLTQPGFKDAAPTAFLRKGIVGEWQTYMTAPSKQWFNDEAGEVLVVEGFAENLNW